jgi:hypothetical protein
MGPAPRVNLDDPTTAAYALLRLIWQRGAISSVTSRAGSDRLDQRRKSLYDEQRKGQSEEGEDHQDADVFIVILPWPGPE